MSSVKLHLSMTTAWAVLGLSLSSPVWATDTAVTTGQTRTTALTLSTGDSLTVSSGGTVNVSSTEAVTITGAAAITNDGILKGTGKKALIINTPLAAGTVLTIVNTGTLTSTNKQVIDFTNQTTAIAARLTNSGVINGAVDKDTVRAAAGMTIINTGTICTGTYSSGSCFGSNSDAGDAIDAQANAGVSLDNSGLISGAKHGITGDEGVTVINRAGASLIGRNGSGVNIDNADFNSLTGAVTAIRSSATVTNYGLISGDYAGSGNGDGDGVDVDGIATIINYGTIRGTGAGGVDSGSLPNASEGIAMGGGTIDNKAGAIIQGASAAILVDNGSGGSGVGATTITNAGTITGQASYAIKLVGNFNDTITNTGTIAGTGALAIDMGAGNDSLTTSGVITTTVPGTAITLGAGNDSMAVTGGRITGGDISGGDGTDGIVFFSPGATGSFTASGTVRDFETVDIKGGTVTLGGLTLAQGAVLTADVGFTVTGSLTNAGTIAAAASPRTITVGGAYTQTGTLNVGISAAGNDRITATGAVALSGTVKAVVANGLWVADNQSYIIASGAGGVSLGTVTVESSSALLSFSLKTDGNNAVLVAKRTNSYTGVTQGQNGQGAARALELAGPGATGDMAAILNQLDGMSSTQATGQAINQMAPTVSGGAVQATGGMVGQGSAVVGQRMAGLRAGAGGAAPSQSAGLGQLAGLSQGLALMDGSVGASPLTGQLPALGLAAGSAPATTGIWGQSFGTTARQAERDGISGYRATSLGFLLGADTQVTPDLTVGFAAGYSQGVVRGSGTDADDRTRIGSYQGSLYGNYVLGDWFVDGLASLARNTYDGSRAISFLGRTAQSDYNGWQYGARLNGGRDFNLGGGWLTPAVSMDYHRLSLDGYTETEAGAANLTVNGQDYDTLTAGLSVSGRLTPIDLGDSATLTPHAMIGWTHDLVADRQQVSSAFAGGGGSFVTTGAKPARDAAQMALGVTLDRGDGASIEAGYQLELREAYVGQAGVIRLRQEF